MTFFSNAFTPVSRLTVVTVLGGILACASSHQTVVVWSKPGASKPELQEARATCLKESAEGADAQGRRHERAELDVRGNAFTTCMEALGWTWSTAQVPKTP